MYYAKENVYINKSNIDGKGAFSRVDILKDSILYDNFEFDLSSSMNDADMKYPSGWSYNDIWNCFHSYLYTDMCNIKVIGDRKYKVIRDIKIGDELTRHYGLISWLEYVFGYYTMTNPFTTMKPKYTNIETNMKEALNNFAQVVIDMGHKPFLLHIKNNNRDKGAFGLASTLYLEECVQACKDNPTHENYLKCIR